MYLENSCVFRYKLLQLQPEHEWQSNILRDLMLNDTDVSIVDFHA